MRVSMETYIEGVKLQITASRITIVYDGNLEIELDPAKSPSGIRALGNLSVKMAAATTDLVAGGTVEVDGAMASGGKIHGREVLVNAPVVKCRVISAEDRIVIGSKEITADAMVAPTIDIDAKVTGRVTVIESQNVRGPTKLKGGLSLQEYDEVFGNAEQFVKDRGLQPLPPTVVADDEDDEFDEQKEAEDLAKWLDDAVARVVASYAAKDLPPSVRRLQELAAARDTAALRKEVDEIWTGVVESHKQRKLKLQHSVTHAFSLIHMLVQR